jgi:glycosyltransferase involved in cell wall biosynthesis
MGRLAYTGATMIVEGLARIGFAVILVERGYGVGGAMAGLCVGVAAGVVLSRMGLPRRSTVAPKPVRPEVWASIFGLFLVGMVQYVDVVAVRIAGGSHGGTYAAAASLARIALYAQIPAAAYAIRRTAQLGPRAALRRVVPLALAPAVVTAAALELFPRQILSVTYGGQYLEGAGILRILTLAMLMAGAALVAINISLGAGRIGWVWSASLASVVGVFAVILMPAGTATTAVVMTAAQATVLAVAVFALARLLASTRQATGVLILNWRDTGHPQGGGSEVFVWEIATRLVRDGRPVTIFCADHEGAPREETVEGVRFVRRGSWRTVYLWAALYHATGRFGPHEVVVDVQNAIPFFAPLYCGRPVVVLVHHVHREQWGMLFRPRTARAGWWVESRVAPWVYRNASYITVSEATRASLGGLGVDPSRVSIVHNGGPAAVPNPLTAVRPRSSEPTIVFLGRLVPHKRVELLIEAAARLRNRFPGLTVRVIGHGGWEGKLRECCAVNGVEDMVRFEGYLEHQEKRNALAESWVLALPSVMEGWGLAVVEAAREGTTSVAFRVGGLKESILDGETGLLVEDQQGFVSALDRILASPAERARLGEAARLHAAAFTWDQAAITFDARLDDAVRGRHAGTQIDPSRASAPALVTLHETSLEEGAASLAAGPG